MKERTKAIIVITVPILIIASIVVYLTFSGGINMNPPGTIGNTAGNLNNSGLFCEYNDTVYFSNPFDNGTLYAMDATESNIRKLNNARVHNILAGGDFLYYIQNNQSQAQGLGSIRSTFAFNRSKLDGSGTSGLTRDIVTTGQLVDNYLYLMVAGSSLEFYKMKIDRSEKVHLADYTINPASVSNGRIYYNGTQKDHYLYAFDTTNDSSTVAWKGNLWYPIVEWDYVYYLDVANDYRLCRYSFTHDVIEVLTNDRVDCFNVGHGYIYYQKNSTTEPALIGMSADGSNKTVIAEGNYTNINMTSRYVYFQPFGFEYTMYHMPLGGTQYSIFQSAQDAVVLD